MLKKRSQTIFLFFLTTIVCVLALSDYAQYFKTQITSSRRLIISSLKDTDDDDSEQRSQQLLRQKTDRTISYFQTRDKILLLSFFVLFFFPAKTYDQESRAKFYSGLSPPPLYLSHPIKSPPIN